jgi:hypothetical protein
MASEKPKKKATPKSSAKKTTKKASPKSAADAQSLEDAAADSKSFEDNVAASIKEEKAGSSRGAKSSSGTMDPHEIVVEDLTSGIASIAKEGADRFKETMEDIRLPEFSMPNNLFTLPAEAPADIQVESLVDALNSVFKASGAEDMAANVSGAVSEGVDKLSETVSGMVNKLKN